jgi:hypothetical protein
MPKSIEDLEHELEQLSAVVVDLQEMLCSEVRTRRLVIVDEKNVERIVGEVSDRSERSAALRVQSPDDGALHVTLYASDDGNSGTTAGWYLSRNGNTAAQAACHDDHRRTVYIDSGLDVDVEPQSRAATQECDERTTTDEERWGDVPTITLPIGVEELEHIVEALDHYDGDRYNPPSLQAVLHTVLEDATR